jgi:large subunit ribosomal protein L13Ae
MKRMVIPDALRVMRLAPRRKYIVLKDLAAQVGWKYRSIIEKLERKRKLRAAAWYQKKKVLARLRQQAANSLQSKLANDTVLLQKHGALIA